MDSKRGQDVVRASQRKEIKEKKEKLKTKRDYIKEAQVAFNAYVRFRDEKRPCISCGSILRQEEQKQGGLRDCGHYLSRGAYPDARHRFGLDNTASQCVKCNRYLGGNVAKFRLGMIERWGLDRVERIESDLPSSRMTIDYLQRLTKIFRKRLRIIKAIRNKKC